MEARWHPHILNFKRPGGTSRGVLHTKETFILEIFDGGREGIGECALFRGLSSDDVPDYEKQMQWLCENINHNEADLKKHLQNFPSIWFGYEQAVRNLKFGNSLYFPSDFTACKASIKINGLIWMGDAEFMKAQINEKLSAGFSCIKIKIGIDWRSERSILEELRRSFPAEQLEIRVDANGAFDFQEAKTVLDHLAELKVHSIEQPLKAGRNQELAALCELTPTPIALDETLIGIYNSRDKEQLLKTIRPQYIILKPALCGGFSGSDEWISLAEQLSIGWWITSALESNIGLNAIAQYTYTKQNPMPQGLGTGALFTNNFESSLNLCGDQLTYKSCIPKKPTSI